jgi:sugar (pentulose or hexulose) kinase
MSEGFLVIDAGSGSVKTFFVSPSGEIIRSTESLWDRDNWSAEKARTIILETIRKLDLASSTVHAVSVTSMREEFVLVNKDGKEVQYTLSPASKQHGENVLAEYGESMYDSSGHWPVPDWIVGAILPWLNDEHPKKIAETKSVLMISDWVNHILCGEACTDGTSACETSLYDIKSNNWNWNLIEELGLPSHIFPEVKNNASRVGEVSEKIASTTGLPSKTPVIMGGADTQCGLLGMGARLGDIAAVGGTTTPVQYIVDNPIIDKNRRTWSNNHLVENQWILESNGGYTGRAVREAKESLGFSGYSELNKEAMNVRAGSKGLHSYLGPHRFNAGPPYWEMDKLGDIPVKQTIVGASNPSRGQQVRSILESNSYAVKANLLQIAEISGVEFSKLLFCGGNTKSSLWMQIQADVLDIPVIVPEVNDGTAIGTAVLASVGSGYYSLIDEAVSNMVRLRTPVIPDPTHVKEYKGHYESWMETRKSLAQG